MRNSARQQNENPTEAANRRELRRELLDRIVVLQMQAQCGDAEARSLLEHARDELRRFDAESLRLFNEEISGASRTMQGPDNRSEPR
jgi:hypothetical protein